MGKVEPPRHLPQRQRVSSLAKQPRQVRPKLPFLQSGAAKQAHPQRLGVSPHRWREIVNQTPRISEQTQLRKSLRFCEHGGRYRLPDIEPMKFLLLCAVGIFATACTTHRPTLFDEENIPTIIIIALLVFMCSRKPNPP